MATYQIEYAQTRERYPSERVTLLQLQDRAHFISELGYGRVYFHDGVQWWYAESGETHRYVEPQYGSGSSDVDIAFFDQPDLAYREYQEELDYVWGGASHMDALDIGDK